jgi:hypothetical protein
MDDITHDQLKFVVEQLRAIGLGITESDLLKALTAFDVESQPVDRVARRQPQDHKRKSE